MGRNKEAGTEEEDKKEEKKEDKKEDSDGEPKVVTVEELTKKEEEPKIVTVAQLGRKGKKGEKGGDGVILDDMAIMITGETHARELLSA